MNGLSAYIQDLEGDALREAKDALLKAYHHEMIVKVNASMLRGGWKLGEDGRWHPNCGPTRTLASTQPERPSAQDDRPSFL